MTELFLPWTNEMIYSYTRPTCFKIISPIYFSRRISITLSAVSRNGVNQCSSGSEFIRKLCISSVFVAGLSLSSLWAFSSPVWASISPPSSTVTHFQKETDVLGNMESVVDFEDENMKEEFERWKSKSYALTVPLRIVALQGSLPSVWIREFLQSQGKRVRFCPEFRQGLADIYQELSCPFRKGKLNSKSAAVADLVTLGDSWVHFTIANELIVPIEGAEDQDWFRKLNHKWKVFLRRSGDGHLDSRGKIWGVPYRWGSMVIAYNKKEFQKHKLAPVKDWSDLWRKELAGKISMVDSPREIIGATLKCMGLSYNTSNVDSQVVGGKQAVMQQLKSLVQQVRLFDSQQYLKAFKTGDVWVAVGWSCDVIPVAKTMSNIAVIVPDSGASLWADFWAIPNSSKHGPGDLIGGRIRGASPLVQQWMEFCLQPERALPFNEETIVGGSPFSMNAGMIPEVAPVLRNKRPKLETNLIRNLPPAEILSRCEFLEPLSEDALSDYKWLISNLPETNHSNWNWLVNWAIGKRKMGKACCDDEERLSSIRAS